MKKFIAITGLLLLVVAKLWSQDTGANEEPVDFDADRYSFFREDSLNQYQIMAGNVIIKQGTSTFYADSAIYNRNTKIVEAFGNVRLNDKDSINIYSQYLHYRTDEKIATLKKSIRLTDGSSVLYTEELEYDLNQSLGTYLNGGRLENNGSVLTSKEATYYGELKDVYFKKNVVLTDPDYTLKTEALLYNTETELANFIEYTEIEEGARKIVTNEGFYDLKNKKAQFGKRPVIYDGSVTITAQTITTDDSTGISKLTGNAVYKDTTEGIAVLANYIESNKHTGSFFATIDPLLILKQNEDSIYITGDTLLSGKLSKLFPDIYTDSLSQNPADSAAQEKIYLKDSADRFFMAWHNVLIFSDSLQGKSDSLFYAAVDSTFKLFTEPVLWMSGSQITGDTIYLYTKNKEADRLYVAENGIIINQTGENTFNQIRGNRLNGYFIEGALDYMRAQGNSESIYYVRDDNEKIIGVNKATSDIIDIRFKNKEINKVVFISEVNGTTYPPSQFPEDQRKLRDFIWREDERPKNKEALFEKPVINLSEDKADNVPVENNSQDNQ